MGLAIKVFFWCLTISVAALPFSSRADCPDEVRMTIEGYDPKTETLLLSSVSVGRITDEKTKRDLETEVEGRVLAVDLRKPRKPEESWKVFYDRNLLGNDLLATLRAEVEKARGDRFVHLSPPLIAAKEKIEKRGRTRIFEKKFEDARGKGHFVVRRMTDAKEKSHFELHHQGGGRSASLKLDGNLLKGVEVNQAGVEVTETLTFIGPFVVGLTRYCMQPIVWTYRLKTPYAPKN